MTINFSKFAIKVDKKAFCFAPDPTRLIIGREPLKDASLPLRDDYLYSGLASELPDVSSIERANLLLHADVKIHPAYYELDNLNIIATDDAEYYKELRSMVRAVFDSQMFVDNFSNRLLHLVQNNAKPQKLLDLAYRVFGNPVLLLDTSLCLMGHAGAEPVVDEPVIEYALKHGFMPSEYLEEVMREESLGLEEDKVLIIWEKTFLKNRLIAGRVVRGNRLLGYIKVFEQNRPFREFIDTEMLQLLCQHMAIGLDPSTGHSFGATHIEAFLIDVLERRIVDDEAILHRLALYNMDLHPIKVAMTVEVNEEFKNVDKLYLLKQNLQDVLNRRTLLVYGKSVVVLFDKEKLEDALDIAKSPAFTNLLESKNCRAAVSMPFRHLTDFPKYYAQALTCFQIASRINEQKHLYLYEDYKLIHMFLHFSEKIDLNDLVHPYVNTLAAIDKKKGSSLLETLFAYTTHGQDITATAEYLHVHYNTLKYRLGRIETLTSMDFGDEQIVFQILLSKHMLELIERIEATASKT